MKRTRRLTVVVALGLMLLLGLPGGSAEVSSGGPESACVVPLAFADCLLQQAGGTLNCSMLLEFSSATEDNIGFTNLLPNTPSVSVPRIREILNNGCESVHIGDHIGIGNGSNLQPMMAALEGYVAHYGREMMAPIVKSTCPNPQFNQLQEIVGFAEFRVEEIVGPPHNLILIRFDC